MAVFERSKDGLVSKAELGEVLLSGSENFSCRCFEPNTASLNISYGVIFSIANDVAFGAGEN
jgi:hypothetical protein